MTQSRIMKLTKPRGNPGDEVWINYDQIHKMEVVDGTTHIQFGTHVQVVKEPPDQIIKRAEGTY